MTNDPNEAPLSGIVLPAKTRCKSTKPMPHIDITIPEARFLLTGDTVREILSERAEKQELSDALDSCASAECAPRDVPESAFGRIGVPVLVVTVVALVAAGTATAAAVHELSKPRPQPE